jgi:hypothetical protein
MATVFCAVLGITSLAMEYDEPRASFTIQAWAFPIILGSAIALMPYLGSIASQGVGSRLPVRGVRVAYAGVLGLSGAVALAIVLVTPLVPALAVLILLVAIALPVTGRSLANEARARRRPPPCE